MRYGQVTVAQFVQPAALVGQPAGKRLAADGIFGDRIHAAVVAVQRYHQIGVDGIYGPQSASTIAVAARGIHGPLWMKVAHKSGRAGCAARRARVTACRTEAAVSAVVPSGRSR